MMSCFECLFRFLSIYVLWGNATDMTRLLIYQQAATIHFLNKMIVIHYNVLLVISF